MPQYKRDLTKLKVLVITTYPADPLGSYLREKDPLGYQFRGEATILEFTRPTWQHLGQGAVSVIRRPMTQLCSHLQYGDPLGSHLEN